MDFTSQMTSLLSELRRERNGEAADAMRFYGKGCGLNLGVALHTVRAVAAGTPRNHDFARFLYRQDVRELRIAALWLAEPGRVEPAEFAFWESGIVNSEIAEQAAMALFSRVKCADDFIEHGCTSDNALTAYTTLLTAARNPNCDAAKTLAAIETISGRFADNRLIGQGAVAALASLSERAPELTRNSVTKISQNNTPTSRYIADEMSWRI